MTRLKELTVYRNSLIDLLDYLKHSQPNKDLVDIESELEQIELQIYKLINKGF